VPETAHSLSLLSEGDLALVGIEVIRILSACKDSKCEIARGVFDTNRGAHPLGTRVMLLQRIVIDGIAVDKDLFVSINQFGPSNTSISLSMANNGYLPLVHNDILLICKTGAVLRIRDVSCNFSSITTSCAVEHVRSTPLGYLTSYGTNNSTAVVDPGSKVLFIHRPGTYQDGPLGFNLDSAITVLDTSIALSMKNPNFPVSLLTDGDMLQIASEIIRITGICIRGKCPVMRGQLGTNPAAATVGVDVNFHTPYASSGFLSKVSTYPVDYHVSSVSGRYVGWNLTLSTSIAHVYGSKVTQLRIVRSNGCGCVSSTGNLEFSGGGGGSGAAGTYVVVDGFLISVVLTSGGRGYTSQPDIVLGGQGCSKATNLIKASIGAGGTGCSLPSGSLMFSGGGGSGASGTYAAAEGTIVSIRLTSGGSFFTHEPSVLVSDRGCSGFAIEAVLSDRQLAGFSRRVTRVVTSSLYDGGLLVGVSIPFPTFPTASTFYSLSPPPPCSLTAQISSKRLSTVSGTIKSLKIPTATSFMLDFRAGVIVDLYVNWSISIFSKSSVETRKVIAYSSDRVITVDSALNATPQAMTMYLLNPPMPVNGRSNPDFSASSFGLDSGSIRIPTFYTGWKVTFSSQVNVSLTNSVVNLTLNPSGSGAGYPPSFTGALLFSGGGGTGAAGTYTTDANGVVISVSLTSGGSDYVSQPTVRLESTGCSRDAVITAYISLGGSGCRFGSGTLIFTGGGGSGAAGTYTAVGGSIQSISVSNFGIGYLSAPSVSVSDSECVFYSLKATCLILGSQDRSDKSFTQAAIKFY